jgi:hypothetical protein
MADGPRWDEVLGQSGLSDTELAQAKASPAYAALLAQLRDGENRGFDVHTELPMLVTGRSFGDADDVASVLHYRVDRYVTGVGYPAPSPSELVAGIFPRPRRIADPDVALALNNRAEAIDRRARELAMIAIERGDAWLQDFGKPPPTNELYERWVVAIATGAAYLDRWGIDNADAILDDAPVNHEQEAQRARVLGAAMSANELTEVETAPARVAYVLSGDGLLEPPNQDFELDQ